MGFNSTVLQSDEIVSSPFLVGVDECEKATEGVVALADSWGWVATCYYGGLENGPSVININQVSGPRSNRVVKNYKVIEFCTALSPAEFANEVNTHCCSGSFPNITVCFNAFGPGHIVVRSLAKLLSANDVKNMRLKTCNWHDKPKLSLQRYLYSDLRSLAASRATTAIKDGRIKLDPSPETINQFSFMPCSFNKSKQLKILSLFDMKRIYQVSSLARADSYCLAFLVDHLPAMQDK